MMDDFDRLDITRRTIMKAVGVGVAVANLGNVTAAPTSRTSDTSPTAVNVALDRCETTYAPDSRVAHYDIEAHEKEGAGVSLHGAVQSEYLRKKAVDAARSIATPIKADDLTVLDASAWTRTVGTAIAPVRGAPDGDSELVTEALYGAHVTAFERTSGWTRVRVPDGYLGWIRTDRLTDAVGGSFDALLHEDTDVSIDGLETLYAGTDCAVVSHRQNENDTEHTSSEQFTVRFRTGVTLELPADAVVQPEPVPTKETIVANANYYLGKDVPYLWGGMTTEGIDCSGFVWMAYRMGGLTLPRDSDQQQKIGEQVGRDELRSGDLLCFPGHIAISIGGARFIHSAGSANGPTTNSLDPDDDDYYEYLDESFEEARRIL